MTLVIAHRGASAYEPENSMAAFRAAVDLGSDGIELDVHATADGVIVVHHDAAVGGEPIGDTAWADLRDARLPNDEPIPLLEDVLTEMGTRVLMFVEVKTLAPVCDAALLQVLDRGPAPERYRVHAFDHRIVRRLRDRAPGLVTGVLSSSYPLDPIGPIQDASATDLWQRASLIDAPLVEAVHAIESHVYGWTVDDPNRGRDLVELGVDGLCSNRPDVMRQVIT